MLNVVLCAFKMFAGIFARSGAMVSDAVHSASDVLSTITTSIYPMAPRAKAMGSDNNY